MKGGVLVEASGLVQQFETPRGVIGRLTRRHPIIVRAVDKVDLDIRRGEIVGLVGESGSGKTTLARAIAGLRRPTEGSVVFDHADFTSLHRDEARRLRRRIQVIYQDAQASLSPRRRIGRLLVEPYQIHGVPDAERTSAEELLGMVGLSSELLRRYPHELSGGQARRVVIARALALRPELLVADEPTAGLDVSTAAGVLNLLRELADAFKLAMLVITHNLGVVGSVADRIAVIYLGQIVELGSAREVLLHPAHPYTTALLSAVSVPRHASNRQRIVLTGEQPNPANPPSGCRFRTRCPISESICAAQPPQLLLTDGDRLARCHFADQVRDHGLRRDRSASAPPDD